MSASTLLSRPYTYISRSPERDSKSRRKHKRTRSYSSDTDSTDSEEERRRRRKKEKRRERKEREREKEKEKSRSDRTRRHYIHSPSHSPSRTPDRARTSDADTPKPREEPLVKEDYPVLPAGLLDQLALDADDSDVEVGPMPPPKVMVKKVDERQYGGALLRGEGSAMAAFLQEGTDVRIPRRGEIGLTSDEIAKYEEAGYVMSGSRHRVMNAVRMRKENQVISAEEKRGILKLQKEERERREMILREEFEELLKEKLKGAGAKPS